MSKDNKIVIDIMKYDFDSNIDTLLDLQLQQQLIEYKEKMLGDTNNIDKVNKENDDMER